MRVKEEIKLWALHMPHKQACVGDNEGWVPIRFQYALSRFASMSEGFPFKFLI